MRRYAQGGDLTQFNEGGTHESSPIGGIPIGNNNSVEQGETKQDNFVYSNRIFLDSNVVSQYNLPKSLVGKSVADATKFIDDKFKGRNDKISQSTKNGMLSKIAEAQEAMKPQEPEMEQPQEGIEQGYPQEMMGDGQMAWGGFADSTIGQGFGKGATGAQQSQAIGAGLGVGMAAFDLGKTAFGKPNIDTSGQFASEQVNSGAIIGSSALKGAQAGMAFGPWGAGIGAAVGAGAGLLGANKAKKAAAENTNNYAINTNKKFSDNYFALGGKMNQMSGGGPTGYGTDGKWIKPMIADYDTNSIKNIQSALGVNPDGNWGPKSSKSLFDYDVTNKNSWALEDVKKGKTTYNDLNNDNLLRNMHVQSRFPNLTPEGYKFTQETPVFPQKGDPIITPTQTKAGFEAYADAKQIADAKQNKSLAGKALNYTNDNLGNIARYAPIAANALQLAMLKKPEGERLDRLGNRYKPEYVDEATLQNIANQTMNNSVNAVGQSGASQGQLRSSIIGSQLQRTKAISDAYSQAAAQNRATNDRAQTFNLGVDQVNLQQSNVEKDINARNQGAYDTEKSKLIGKIGDNIGSVGTEQAYKKIAKNTTGYSWLGEFQKMNPNATKEETVIAAKKAGVAIDDKKALGSYLIKNKVK